MNATNPETPAFTATVDDVAKAYNVSVRTVWRWLDKSVPPPHRKIGGVLRFNLEEVDRWAAQQTQLRRG